MHRSWLQATVLGTALVLSGYGNPATVKTQTQTQPVESAALERLKDTEILFWTPEQQRLGYPNIEKLITTGVIRRGKSASLLPASPRDFSKFTYAYNGKTRTIEDFFYQTNAVGLLVLKDGRVVLERYAGGNTAQTKWISFSIAKSVTSLLYGAAIRDRHIKTLDDQVIKYVPELAGTAYDGVTLRHLLQMSSGVAWNDDPRNRESDVAKLTQIDREGGLKALLAYMGRRPRRAHASTTTPRRPTSPGPSCAPPPGARCQNISLRRFGSRSVCSPMHIGSRCAAAIWSEGAAASARRCGTTAASDCSP